jgi:Zn finger protein HypA/HybF involved in hydrogenase expression
MIRKFQRTVEDFVCENCGAKVQGNGYTNHCPVCLWSKHVDVNPGDRANPCGGLMEPVDTYFKAQQWYLKHRCQKCELEKNIKIAKEDNFGIIEDILQSKVK